LLALSELFELLHRFLMPGGRIGLALKDELHQFVSLFGVICGLS
jgi:hypothetical protein